MRFRVPLALAALLVLAPVASAALPWSETFPSCYSSSALTLVACETNYADGTNCPGTSIAVGTVYGGRCNGGFGTHQTCISVGATAELYLASWCYWNDHYGRATTMVVVYGVAEWRSMNTGGCSTVVANAVNVGCPAGGPPTPDAVPVTWGYVLP